MLLARLPMLRATHQTEASGDAMATLEVIEKDLARGEGGKDFWRPERVTRLIQLVVLGSVLPRWATSRWILEQAAQSMDPDSRTRGRKALEIAIKTQGGVQQPAGVEDAEACVKLIDHDWVFRQVLLYELGALQDFLARLASPGLRAGADSIDDWARTPMGGYRFVSESSRSLVWRELATGGEVTSLNLGGASMLEPGECGIGRLVPIDEGAMFESVPLFVPDDVAQEVADDPRDWVATVAAACHRSAPAHQQITTRRHDFRLLTDVPKAVQQVNAHKVWERSTSSRSDDGHAADPKAMQVGFVRAALDGELSGTDDFWGSPWPSVAASLLNPSVFLAVATELVSADAPKLARMALLLPSPADEVCRRLVRDVRQAA